METDAVHPRIVELHTLSTDPVRNADPISTASCKHPLTPPPNTPFRSRHSPAFARYQLDLQLRLHHQVGKQNDLNYTHIAIVTAAFKLRQPQLQHRQLDQFQLCLQRDSWSSQDKQQIRCRPASDIKPRRVQVQLPPLSAHLRGSDGCRCPVSDSIGKPYVKAKPRTTSPTRT